jgi:transcription antitermination protein NusB
MAALSPDAEHGPSGPSRRGDDNGTNTSNATSANNAANGNDSTEAARRRATVRRTDTTNPRTARTRALKVLFQADLRGVSPAEALARLADDAQARAILDAVEPIDETTGEPIAIPTLDEDPATTRDAPAIDGFTRRLVTGVSEHLDELDAVIGRHAHRWQVSRMPAVDRAVLRLAAYELLHEDTPHAVTIDEAVNLAKELSTDDSGRYVNGVLEAIRRTLPARS